MEDALFFAALHVTDKEQREVLLDEACVGDSSLLSAVVVNREEVEFELKDMPGEAGKNHSLTDIFSYSKGFDPEKEDPNKELLPK